MLILISLFSGSERSYAYDYTRETSKERAIFAYFRAAGSSPDFEKWIKESATYPVISAERKSSFLMDEMTRLGRGFGEYDYDKDLLELTLYGTYRYYAAEGNEKAYIKFIPENRYAFATTFEFPYGHEEITLFVPSIEKFYKLELSPEEAEKVEERIPFLEEDFTARFDLQVRVTKTDDRLLLKKSEGQVEGRAMLGDIAYVKAMTSPRYNMEFPMLWDYVAPWYKATYVQENLDEDKKYPHPYDIEK